MISETYLGTTYKEVDREFKMIREGGKDGYNDSKFNSMIIDDSGSVYLTGRVGGDLNGNTNNGELDTFIIFTSYPSSSKRKISRSSIDSKVVFSFSEPKASKTSRG